MALLSGAMTVRRFRLDGDIPDAFRDIWREAIEAHAFRDGPLEQKKEEREGWVQIHNLLDTDFGDFNQWLYGEVVLLGLRVDKKSLPAKLFKATVEQRVKAWCQERGVTRCPRSEKDAIAEALEAEWLSRQLPRVAVLEVLLHLGEGYALVHSHSDNAVERVRKLVFETFGLKLVPWSPLDFMAEPEVVEALLETVPHDLGGAA